MSNEGHSQTALMRGHGARPPRLRTRQLMPTESHYRPRSRSAAANLLGWLILIVIFPFLLMTISSSVVPFLALILLMVISGMFSRHGQSMAIEKNQEAVNLLNSGEIDAAADTFERLAERERNSQAHPVYVFNRGVTYLLQGRLRRAFSLFNAVEKSRQFHGGRSRAFLPLLYAEMSACLALMGQLDDAHDYYRRALRSAHRSEVPRLIFAEAVLALRQGEAVYALEKLREEWRGAEAVLRTPTLKALRLLRAFALEQVGGAGGEESRFLLDGLRPCRRGEFDWIGVEWPAFRDFLRRHGLS